MKRILTVITLAISSMTMMAEEFKIGKLTFEIISSTEVSLKSADQDITKVFLGETVNYQGKTYTLTEIGERAFYRCSSLTSITIPCSVEDIETMAFFNCKSLTSVTILSCRRRFRLGIRYGAFIGCSSLKSVIIPNNIKRYFNWEAFEGSALYNDPSNWENGALYINNCLIKLDKDFVGNCTIKENTYLIAEWAFRDCTSLTSVTIPNSIKIIGDGAFSGCKSLTSVNIPNSVTEIGQDAFIGCSSLTSITVDAGNTHYDSRNNCNAIIETATNTLIAGCKTTTIPNSVTSVGGNAFSGCTSLTSITIPNSVTEIGWGAFDGCTNLKTIYIPRGSKARFAKMDGLEDLQHLLIER